MHEKSDKIIQLQAELEKTVAWGRSLDREVADKSGRILEIQAESEKMAAWGRSLNEQIEIRDKRILELQEEVQKLGTWGHSLDAAIESKDKLIVELYSHLGRIEAVLNERNEELKNFLNSFAWSIAKIFYRKEITVPYEHDDSL